MRLSVCLIVRDEERFLAGCIESIREIAGEIVVVDTGSRDRTRELARELGCRVIEHAWSDDFAAARNVAIEHAAGEWVLFLDADERLCRPLLVAPLLRDAAPDVGGFALARHDVVTHAQSGRTDVYAVPIVRLFRRHPAIRYVGAVHERPGDTILAAGLRVVVAPPGLHLTHLVNALPRARLEEKQRRYLALLERELDRDPRNVWARYYRGKTLWFLARRAEARRDFEEVHGDPRAGVALRAAALCMTAAVLAELGLVALAAKSLDDSLALAPRQSLAHYVRAELRYGLGDHAGALNAYERVRCSDDEAGGWEPIPGDLVLTVEKKSYKLGCCLLALGRVGEAASWFDRGLEAAPADAGCRYGRAHVALLEGDRPRALAELDLCLRDDPGWRAPRALRERCAG